MLKDSPARQGGCRKLAPGEYGWPDILCRQLQLWPCRAAARLLGKAVPLESMLHRALRATTLADGGFFIPSAFAEAILGEALFLEPPLSGLKLRLADWIRCRGATLHSDTYFLGSGDWRAIAEPIRDSPVFREAQELIACGFRYRQTEAYAGYLSAMADKRPIRRNRIPLSDRQRLEAYFLRFVELFRSIEKNGVLRQGEFSRRLLPGAPAMHRTAWIEHGEREIGAAIGATGEIFRLPGGQHRTAIAFALGLPRIPVQIRMVHADWLQQEMKKNHVQPVEAIRCGISRLRGY